MIGNVMEELNQFAGLKLMSSIDFEKKIKSMMTDNSSTMIESILMYCESNGIEVETAAALVSPRMKSEIETEAINSRMIISKKARLPIA